MTARIRKLFSFVLGFAIVTFIGYTSDRQASPDLISVRLEKRLWPNTGNPFGISNIFFQDAGANEFSRPPEWKDIRIAEVIENGEFKPIFAVQYKDASGAVRFAVDTNGDRDFKDEKPIVFEKSGDLQFADVQIQVAPKSGTPAAASPVAYQIVQSGQYTYARVREYRAGMLKIGPDSYAVLLRAKSRGCPFFGLERSLLYVDLNCDGEISQFWREQKNGELIPTEEIPLSRPFLIAGHKFEAESVDPAGRELVFRPSSIETAAAVGFKAPDLAAADLDGLTHSLRDSLGRVVLLDFWSVDCPWGDSVRPLLNGIAEKYRDSGLTVLSIAREKDPAVIRDYLKTKPKSPTVLLQDEKAWTTYNPDWATPTCYVIDRNGVIRLWAQSAAAVKALDKTIAGLMAEK